MHATTWIDLKGVMLSGEKKGYFRRPHTVRFNLYRTLEMIKITGIKNILVIIRG